MSIWVWEWYLGILSIWVWVLVGQIYSNPHPKPVIFVYKAFHAGDVEITSFLIFFSGPSSVKKENSLSMKLKLVRKLVQSLLFEYSEAFQFSLVFSKTFQIYEKNLISKLTRFSCVELLSILICSRFKWKLEWNGWRANKK